MIRTFPSLHRITWFCLLALTFSPLARPQQTAEPDPAPTRALPPSGTIPLQRSDEPSGNPRPPALRATDAVILGIVEGVTEFLPISSTGHLIITNQLLGLEDEQPLRAMDGKPLWYKSPTEKNPHGIPLTFKLAADTFTVVIQAGAILAVVLLYWRQLLRIVQGMLGRDPEGLRLLRNLLAAFVPVAAVGLLAHDWIDKHLFSVEAVVVAQISGAVLMIAAERWRKENVSAVGSGKEASDLSLLGALGIGFMQCLALWPGMSRSMVTIVGGYFNRLSPAKAAEFSFLVGLPVLGGAAFVKSVKSGSAMIAVFGWSHVILGVVVATISAALAVKFLVHFLSRHGLFAFALYRIALAAVLGLWFLG